jgi:cobalt-zinc-cadmium efflux system outer membrane protein
MAACALAGYLHAQPPSLINLDEAIRLALRHNHTLAAARMSIQQSQADEITAKLRPNPSVFATWAYLPLQKPGDGYLAYLRDDTEGDVGLSYTRERGNKRFFRVQAARDATSVARSQIEDNERALTFQVATLFVNAQLAQSTIDLADENLKSFQKTVDIGESQFKAGAISENDYLKIKLQLLQFETDVQQARLSKVQALADLRLQLGYESVPPNFDVVGPFEYRPILTTLPELQAAALRERPDLRAAEKGVTAATSQHALAKANGKQDLTVTTNYSHVSGFNAATLSFSIPLPIFDRNQGEIVKANAAIAQAREQEAAVRGQVLTEVKDAYEALLTSDRVARFYQSGYLDISQRNRSISEYAYNRGAASLLDFLDAERSYRATQLSYRQAIAAYLLAVEQLRQAVGARTLP